MNVPRIVISAPKSGSGKTFISITLMKAFSLRGKKVAAFKCGPDYIDPMFHRKILNLPAKNLDLFFTDENTTRNLFLDDNKSDISIIEGVMGLYDGLGGISEEASTYALAKALSAPIILVIDAHGMSYSILAEIAGFLSMDSEHLIRGVILNRTTSHLFSILKTKIEKAFNIKALGYFQEVKEINIESRYLGLKLPDEISGIEENIKKAALKLEKSVDIAAVFEIAKTSPELEFNKKERTAYSKKIRIGVALDKAFCFYYEDNLRLLESYGAELVYFSPLKDECLPPDINGLILGGGYPELFAKELEQNEQMRFSVKTKLSKGLPCLAECGGFIYLHKTLRSRNGETFKMAGVIDGEAYWAGKLVRFGYVSIHEKNPEFIQNGKEIKGHEFHYFDSTNNGTDLIEEKSLKTKTFEAGFADEKHFLGFAHLYYPSNPAFAGHFIDECRKWQNQAEVL